MDQDDVDQYRARSLTDAGTTDATKLHNLTALRASGLAFTETNSGDILVFRERGKPTVEFYTRRSRWKVRGRSITQFGSTGQFITWLAKFRGQQ